jgi:hypothetical protein
MSGGRLKQIFTDTDMRCNHDGLYAIAKKEGIDITKLQEGEYVAFFNSRRTHLKIAAAHYVIASKRAPDGRFYDLACITEVVRAFHNTGQVDYNAALKKRLTELLEKKRRGND